MEYIFSLLLNIVYPEWCVICGTGLLMEDFFRSYPLCRRCEQTIRFRSERLCRTCSKPLISERDICLQCREREFLFRNNYSLMSYRGVEKLLIRAYKFQNRKNLSRYLSGILHKVILFRYGSCPVVPVPPRPRGKRKRGWDPLERICRELDSRYSITILRCLKRKGGKQQKTLDYDKRITNMRGNIYPKKDTGIPEQVILLDDVFTTGATLNECTRILHQIGAKSVFCITLAAD